MPDIEGCIRVCGPHILFERGDQQGGEQVIPGLVVVLDHVELPALGHIANPVWRIRVDQLCFFSCHDPVHVCAFGCVPAEQFVSA